LGDTGDRGRYLDEPPAAVVEEEIDDDDAPLVHSRVQPSQLRGESDVWSSERPQ
jgi:hypothetical protein